LLITGIAVTTCVGQESPAPKFYKLDFVIKEVEANKVLNARTYSILAATGPSSSPYSIRTSVQIQVGPPDHWQQVEIGTRIDCHKLVEIQNQLSLTVSVDVTGLAQETTNLPLVRHFIWGSEVLVPIKKPTVGFSSDNATSKAQMQVELTAISIP